MASVHLGNEEAGSSVCLKACSTTCLLILEVWAAICTSTGSSLTTCRSTRSLPITWDRIWGNLQELCPTLVLGCRFWPWTCFLIPNLGDCWNACCLEPSAVASTHHDIPCWGHFACDSNLLGYRPTSCSSNTIFLLLGFSAWKILKRTILYFSTCLCAFEPRNVFGW